MLEVIIFVVVLLIIIAIIFLYCRSDNKGWLEVKANAEHRLSCYDGPDLDWIEELVIEFGLCCERIAACVPVWEAKRGLIYANRATEITEELARLGFFEKTQDDTEGKGLLDEKETA